MNTQKTGEFIKALRKENNMTQSDLAGKLNCADKAVSRWETGKGLPDADMLLSLSSVFGVSINEILLGERFIFAASESKSNEMPEHRQMLEDFILTTDETIVELIKDKEKEVGKLNASTILLIFACCLQVLIFFVIPNVILVVKPTAEPVSFLIYASFLNFIFAGLIKDKCRWLFPLFVAVCMLAPLVTEMSEGFINYYFAVLFGGTSALIMAVITGVRYIVKRIKTHTTPRV